MTPTAARQRPRMNPRNQVTEKSNSSQRMSPRNQVIEKPFINNSSRNNPTVTKNKGGNPAWKKGMAPLNPKGRPKGAKNKMPSMIRMAMESGELPLAFMLRMMRDNSKPDDFRLQAASAAAPYTHRKMPQGIEVTPGRYGSLTADQLRQLPTPALQQLLQASQVFYQQLVQLGVAQPAGEIIDVVPT